MTGNTTASIGPQRGVLLVNLGSPDTPSPGDVRRYLRQFLMDRHVLDVPWPLRKLIVEGFILPFRPKRSAAAYRSVWTDAGSPLIVNSRRVRERLAQVLPVPVGLAMSYGRPSLEDGLGSLLQAGGDTLDEVLLVPLYPHYAMSTYEAVVDAVRKRLRTLRPSLRLSILPPFFEDKLYIDALVAVARDHLSKGFDHLLFSYHGLPERHLRKSDPTGQYCLSREDCCSAPSPVHATCYRAQVLRTTEAFVLRAGVPPGKYSVAFQSRLGKDRWLQPFTADELVRLGRSGVARLLVICPAFVTDCLETLEEIGQRGRETFLAAGGKEFELIPCLNDAPVWIDALAHWCRQSYPDRLAENRGTEREKSG